MLSPQTNTIFLIGFMGCGKSYWGKVWADQLKFTFVELDELIERQERMSIADVFEQRGEDHFREIETNILKKQIAQNNCIISTGGGTPCFFDNMQWMNQHGSSIYLKATAQQLALRLQDEKEKRPLIKNIPPAELEAFIAKKLAERDPFYERAQIILSTEVLNSKTLADIID